MNIKTMITEKSKICLNCRYKYFIYLIDSHNFKYSFCSLDCKTSYYLRIEINDYYTNNYINYL